MLPHLEDIVCSAVMVESGSSTARKTAITTMSIMVVLFASLCLRSRASLLLGLIPNIERRLGMRQLSDVVLNVT